MLFFLEGMLTSLNTLHDRVNRLVHLLLFENDLKRRHEEKRINARQYAIATQILQAGRPVALAELRRAPWYRALYLERTDKTKQRDLQGLRDQGLVVWDKAKRLTADGVVVWLDEAEINIGDSLIDKISAAIDQMKFVAAVISSNSIGSAWVQKERSLAISAPSTTGATLRPNLGGGNTEGLRIVGIVKERTRQDPQYSGLQDYFLQLSARPPAGWQQHFIAARRFPRHTWTPERFPSLNPRTRCISPLPPSLRPITSSPGISPISSVRIQNSDCWIPCVHLGTHCHS
ncbi:toll/interleukin-1 receptor domain-containing protein [Candidatus Thiodictyon syntrophicum]|uniref:toll/interleukin-1 receptor domain-containing protein n=1 Tax=Candidatus Thiodictyon syntrophicum TaxID=1166950 RepID=UPI001F1DCD1D|nr:toll/interleukin-1 receptor domain-containing protein [Candidatus Thiodictyon syntrophicum]